MSNNRWATPPAPPIIKTRVDPAARARLDALALKALAIVRAQEAAELASKERAA